MATKYTKQPNGQFRTRVWNGTYKDGKKQYVYLSSTKSSKDLEKKVQEYKSKLNGTVKSTLNVYEYALQWHAIVSPTISQATQRNYAVACRHLKPLEVCTFDTLSNADFQQIVTAHADSPSTCEYIVIVFKRVLKAAEKDKLLPRGSAEEIGDVIYPRHHVKERRPLYDTEIEAIFNANLRPIDRAFLFILLGTGIRREEALALTVNDFKDGTVRIDKALDLSDPNTRSIKCTKSKNGVRTIPLPDFLKEFLAEYLPTCESGLLFPKNGDYFYLRDYRSLWNKTKGALTRYYKATYGSAPEEGFTDLTAHLFRHNYCSRLCYRSITHGDISTKKIAELLGDTEGMVIKVYSHIMKEYERTEDAINGALDFSAK